MCQQSLWHRERAFTVFFLYHVHLYILCHPFLFLSPLGPVNISGSIFTSEKEKHFYSSESMHQVFKVLSFLPSSAVHLFTDLTSIGWPGLCYTSLSRSPLFPSLDSTVRCSMLPNIPQPLCHQDNMTDKE